MFYIELHYLPRRYRHRFRQVPFVSAHQQLALQNRHLDKRLLKTCPLIRNQNKNILRQIHPYPQIQTYLYVLHNDNS